MKVVKIPVDKIEQNENSRVTYKQVDLSELMVSMKKDGLLQPIGVKPLANGKYEAVFGNRRLLSARKLGWDEIEANVLDIDSDNERDILGLIENMKRQNTTVAEDARMFLSLKDRGLSESEIAARLDITEIRVKSAIEVYNYVPEDFRQKVVYTHPGKKKSSVRNTVSASAAIGILNVRKTVGLNRAQTRSLFAYAADKRPSMEHIQKIAPLVKAGSTIEEAIERVSSLERVVIAVYLTAKQIEKIESKNDNKSIHDVFRDCLSKEFKFDAAPPEKNIILKRHGRTMEKEALS